MVLQIAFFFKRARYKNEERETQAFVKRERESLEEIHTYLLPTSLSTRFFSIASPLLSNLQIHRYTSKNTQVLETKVTQVKSVYCVPEPS